MNNLEVDLYLKNGETDSTTRPDLGEVEALRFLPVYLHGKKRLLKIIHKGIKKPLLIKRVVREPAIPGGHRTAETNP